MVASQLTWTSWTRTWRLAPPRATGGRRGRGGGAGRRGESVKILEVGSLVLFGLLTAYTLLAAPRWTVATVRLAVDGGFFGTCRK